MSHHYTYDDRYRLIAAAGTWTGAADSASYTLSMDYDIMGNPVKKVQAPSGSPKGGETEQELTYTYGGEKPNAPTQVGDRRYEYDANGNQSYWEDTTSKEYRQLLWDEENRLMAVDDNGYLSRYVYDHSGQRVVKAHGGLQGVYRNGAPVTPLQHAAKYTLYVSPYMTVTQDRFTKHYYAGTRRILSKNGTGVFNNMYRPGVAGVTAGGVNYFSRAAQIENAKNEYIKSLGIPPGPPTMKGIYAQPEYTGQGFPDGGTPVQDPPRGWPRKPVFNPPGGPPGPPIQWGDELTNETVEPGFGYIGTGAIPENDQYFYHPDHLGSTAYVTNITGAVCQFFVYLPYGETLIDKHSSPWKVPYTFSAKEQDAETKLTYFEARYYDSKYITFLSVDPQWVRYPGISPYMYCADNPAKYVDPTGGYILGFKSAMRMNASSIIMGDGSVRPMFKLSYLSNNHYSSFGSPNYQSAGNFIYNANISDKITYKSTPNMPLFESQNGTSKTLNKQIETEKNVNAVGALVEWAATGAAGYVNSNAKNSYIDIVNSNEAFSMAFNVVMGNNEMISEAFNSINWSNDFKSLIQNGEFGIRNFQADIMNYITDGNMNLDNFQQIGYSSDFGAYQTAVFQAGEQLLRQPGVDLKIPKQNTFWKNLFDTFIYMAK